MSSEFEYQSDNIIVGSAELPAVTTPHGMCWVLPGGILECSREDAIQAATRMNKQITGNLRKYRRKLFRR